MTSITSEKTFEDAIEKSLLEKGGYIKGSPSDFIREIALDKKTVFTFLKESQLEKWKKLQTIHRKDTESRIL